VVRLTRTDLDRLASKVGLASAGALRGAGLVSWVREPLGDGRTVWRPRLKFRTKPVRQCPFLVNDVAEDGSYRGLCSLHPDFKPLVCALSPLAREVADDGRRWEETWSFVPPVEGCPGVGRGEVLPLAPPAPLLPRLADEVAWIRHLIARSPACTDEAAAWSLLEGAPS